MKYWFYNIESPFPITFLSFFGTEDILSSLKMGVVLDIIVRIILPSENVVFVISHVSDSMTTGVLGEFHKPMSPGPFVLLCKWPISKRILRNCIITISNKALEIKRRPV